MIKIGDLKELLKMRSADQPVLSVYLDVARAINERRAYRLVFKDLLKSLRKNIKDRKLRKALREEAARVNSFLDLEYTQQGQGLAIFSCSPKDFWRVYHLPVSIPNDVHFTLQPYVSPLVELIDEYERYGVVLVDKEKARLFVIYLGQIEEQEEVFDLVPGKHKQGGWSQANYQRHHEAHVHWHLKHVAQALVEYYKGKPFDRLIIGAANEVASELPHLLPKELADRISGIFAVPITASATDILQETLAIEQEIERQQEERLVENLITCASKVGPGALGLDDTLFLLQEGRVRQLLIADGYIASGYECLRCGNLIAQTVSRCPLCRGKIERTDGLIEKAVEMALAKDSEVEIVKGKAKDRLLTHGGIGALLRF
ncbi:MAG: hypothetical protein M1136_10415 [Chloroflexi bacterium]|nr:hypothetical protein [Chloroflexota bacterium]MCL5076043.1 hypothetical protein [Chloroflexota bacterium]